MNLGIFRLLLTHSNIDVNIKSNYYGISKSFFFFYKIRFNIIHVMSALHRAIEREKYEIVEILLSHPNIDVDAKMTDINNGIQKKNFNQI